jgi:hypothetical protein
VKAEKNCYLVKVVKICQGKLVESWETYLLVLNSLARVPH